MRLELAERLRCPASHAPTPLIIVADVVRERDLVRGTAGCPICHAEVRIADGDVWFEDPAARATPQVLEGFKRSEAHDAAGLERVMALLGLSEAGGTILLMGDYARFATALAANLDFSVVTMGDSALGPAPGTGVARGIAVSSVHGSPRSVPFSDGSFRAAALDDAHAAEVVRCVAPGGRLLGPIALTLPAGVRELARDDREWVGERVPTAPMVTLGRRA